MFAEVRDEVAGPLGPENVGICRGTSGTSLAVVHRRIKNQRPAGVGYVGAFALTAESRIP